MKTLDFDAAFKKSLKLFSNLEKIDTSSSIVEAERYKKKVKKISAQIIKAPNVKDVTKKTSNDTDQKFDDAFDNASLYLEYIEEAEGAVSERDKNSLNKKAQLLSNRITPASRQAASKLHRHVINEFINCTKSNNAIPNISAFIRDLRESGRLLRKYATNDKLGNLTDDAIRKVIREKLGLKKKPGRNRK